MKILKKLKFVILPIGLFILILLFLNLFKIDTLICESQLGDCSSGIVARLSPAKNKPLLKSKSILKSALKNDINVKEFKIHFNLPSKLKVSIIERLPKFALYTIEDGKVAEISEDGKVLVHVDSTSLPKIAINGFLRSTGEVVDNKTLFALKLVNGLFGSYPVKNTTYRESFLDIELDSGVSVLFPLEGDRDLLLGSFVLIYDELNKSANGSKIDISLVKTIDLRFNKPVLRKNSD